MAFDPPTLLTVTVALALAAALYLITEWRSAREKALLYWATGFFMVVAGSSLSLLRSFGFDVIGVWFANGLLVVAHGCFLLGVAHFINHPLSRLWWVILPAWCVLLPFLEVSQSAKLYMVVNSLLVALLSLKAGQLLKLEPALATAGTHQLRGALLIHGAFYLIKAVTALTPGALIDLRLYQGVMIRVSLVEGVMAILLIALSMTGTVRYRRERQIKRLAERDSLTSLYNRRGFQARAPFILGAAGPQRPAALLLIDIDNFKMMNDLHGHAAGDHMLVSLSDLTRQLLPGDALNARLGGDEFAILLQATSADEVERVSRHLRHAFNDLAAKAFDTPQPVTLSLGATLIDTPHPDLSTLLGQSDQALYEAKRDGRNQLRILGT
ncbi:GGDEF domain-containing protein [Halomonas sp. HNIBRBA4712]|uniref:GGDEF domain-containing protein n=1 Tax=Halomonas sp. HNIBRBA4712 TaxID=3373087 RepID=UPI003747420E